MQKNLLFCLKIKCIIYTFLSSRFCFLKPFSNSNLFLCFSQKLQATVLQIRLWREILVYQLYETFSQDQVCKFDFFKRPLNSCDYYSKVVENLLMETLIKFVVLTKLPIKISQNVSSYVFFGMDFLTKIPHLDSKVTYFINKVK